MWLIDWFNYFRNEDRIEGTRLPIFIATLWGIWYTRNDKVFKLIPTNLEEALSQHTRYHVPSPRYARQTLLYSGPPLPLDYVVVNLGIHKRGTSYINIIIDGSWAVGDSLHNLDSNGA